MKNWQKQAIAVVSIITLMWVYAREFPVFNNTIGVKNLILSSIAITIFISIAAMVSQRKRLMLLEDRLPAILGLVIFPALFSPLFGSLINRLGASGPGERSFVFQKEEAFRTSRFGLLAGLQKEPPAGYHLFVKTGDKKYRFTYKRQAYFPLTKPGELVLLPVKTGLLGFPIVNLK